MARRYVTRDGRPVDLDLCEPAAVLHRAYVAPLTIETIMRDAGIAHPPPIPPWPAVTTDGDVELADHAEDGNHPDNPDASDQ
ncbi:hypothetical protein [Candidatus Frankia nodulisporulans]|uniref:hypothetical protein n=1 Tax=Candidatus Frankia nodulisporulans TaxID=2060052 RepID=UPI0013D2C718|nr:hypothetical protein [Candidatus Frankia nodulisporulans]